METRNVLQWESEDGNIEDLQKLLEEKERKIKLLRNENRQLKQQMEEQKNIILRIETANSYGRLSRKPENPKQG